MTLLVVTQLVTLDSHRLCRELPASHDGGAVQGLQLEERSWRHCCEEEEEEEAANMKSVHTHTHWY